MISMVMAFVLLLILLLVSYTFSYKNIILTPQFGFISGFLLSVGYGMFWVNEWKFELSISTFLVLILGSALFVSVSFFIQHIGIKYRFRFGKRTVRKDLENSYPELTIESWKLVVFLILQLLILFMTLYYLIYRVGGGLYGAIYAINSSSKTEEESIGFPFLLRQLRNLSFASSFFWSYLLVHSIVYKYKNYQGLLFLNIALSMLIYLLGGARQGAIQLIISAFVMAYFFWGESIQWRRKIKIRTVFKVCILGLVLILSYQFIGNIFGRNFNIDAQDYIAAYIAAPIKNLDTFIRRGNFGQGNSFSKTQTFAHLANQLAGRFGFPERAFKFDQPYNYVNGHYLGNVYTTFWAFLYDGGYLFLIFMIVLMAYIMQIVFLRVVKRRTKEKFALSLLIYSYMYFECVFSFFTCWFFARTFNTSFLYYSFYWLCLKLFVERVHLGGEKEYDLSSPESSIQG